MRVSVSASECGASECVSASVSESERERECE